MDLSIQRSPVIKFRLHIIIGTLLLIVFILIIARITDSGTPKTRTNIWGIVVCIKSAIFMAYQIMTSHMDRLKRWASAKVYMILNIIDTVFWFALFVITIMGTRGSTTGSSRALGGVAATLVFFLCGFAGLLAFVSIRDRRFFKAHGFLPGAKPTVHPSC
ncbi:Pc21g12870 [Penicillium rubens Wisconsin 54-1255]|uniref:Pc21g12870 protein n=1 Tax=Penicillium rubens (strain ATCC 28089 / DSM 1075 / NRRL 1951 / Wisconsin 54-1255) TaxID=500485 RepID=B6HM27_PENRW|nr:uncharacterized protein N7525_007853 [Penicillium rubens]KAJ5829600.1 hypothetical protein N7525_007853 [Penicillium rubens]KAJ5852942.1 hypothetical protein N7534_005485 [Penicillium rubens]CAP96184.1 Pc21g12870 [Penicillium rubens Wisconsin 54-1255]